MTAPVLGAFAYALGIITETVARWLFEWRLDQVKLARFEEFRMMNSDLLNDDPLLGRFHKGLPCSEAQGREEKEKHEKTAKHLIGLMRFRIMHRSPDLSSAVESHVKRMRVLRMLALVQVLFLVGILPRCFFPPYWVAVVICVIVAGMVVVTFRGINDRFHRYCREIERGYLVLSVQPRGTDAPPPGPCAAE